MALDLFDTEIDDVKEIIPKRFGDERGYFGEVYNVKELADAGITDTFVFDAFSFSAAQFTLRGMHFQIPPSPQAKIVQVVQGAILDVVVDIRNGSPTYGQHVARTLTADKGNQLYVPEGFAHGFCTLEENVRVAYKISGYYAPETERGINWQDETLGIDWPVKADDAMLNDRDAAFPNLADFDSPFNYQP